VIMIFFSLVVGIDDIFLHISLGVNSGAVYE